MTPPSTHQASLGIATWVSSRGPEEEATPWKLCLPFLSQRTTVLHGWHEGHLISTLTPLHSPSSGQHPHSWRPEGSVLVTLLSLGQNDQDPQFKGEVAFDSCFKGTHFVAGWILDRNSLVEGRAEEFCSPYGSQREKCSARDTFQLTPHRPASSQIPPPSHSLATNSPTDESTHEHRAPVIQAPCTCRRSGEPF